MAEELSLTQIDALLEACGYNNYIRKQQEAKAAREELATRAIRLMKNLRDGEYAYRGQDVVGHMDPTLKEFAAAQIIEELLQCLGIETKE